MRTRTRWTLVGIFLAVVFAVVAVSTYCVGTFWRYRLLIHKCPDGALRQVVAVRADGLRRGAWGPVSVLASARYMIGDPDQTLSVPVTAFATTLALVDAAGKETPLPPDEQGWRELGVGRQALVRVHVLTDRPLYQPGQTARFRALVLRARDLAPLDGRPGRWTVKDPAGEVLLEEKAPAGP